jgi:hypothetical protein
MGNLENPHMYCNWYISTLTHDYIYIYEGHSSGKKCLFSRLLNCLNPTKTTCSIAALLLFRHNYPRFALGFQGNEITSNRQTLSTVALIRSSPLPLRLDSRDSYYNYKRIYSHTSQILLSVRRQDFSPKNNTINFSIMYAWGSSDPLAAGYAGSLYGND